MQASTTKFANKEKGMFQQMLNFYDEKLYDKGMQHCERILEKHPEHPETLSMKALFMQSLKRNKEAFALIKVVLMKNMNNFQVWHVYGMLNRTMKDYDMARKAYNNAIKIGGGKAENNEGVFRDLSVLQCFLRDFEGFKETRREILMAKPGLLTNWVTFAMANYMAQDYNGALDAVTSMFKFESESTTIKPKTPRAIFKVQNTWAGINQLPEADIVKAVGGDQRLVEVVKYEMCETLKTNEFGNFAGNLNYAEKRLEEGKSIEHPRLAYLIEQAKLHKDNASPGLDACCQKFIDVLECDKVLHMKTAQAAHHFLTKYGSAHAGPYAAKAKELFPLNTYFWDEEPAPVEEVPVQEVAAPQDPPAVEMAEAPAEDPAPEEQPAAAENGANEA